MGENVICTDCIHCNEYENEYACFRKPNRYDPVDGSEILTKPKLCRLERRELFWAWWACGKHGRFFVHRDAFNAQESIDPLTEGMTSDEMAPGETAAQDDFQQLTPPEAAMP